MLTPEQLEEKALWVRRKVLEMAVAADSGHVSTAMSQTEILVALYYGGILRHDPKNPKWDGRDIFILSKGQGGIGLYPILADLGYFPVSDLCNFTGRGSKIGVHAESHCPGIEILSGSLGHGLPIATGIAQALKEDGKNNFVFCLVGDGELHEGSNWEAMLTAAHLKLGNLAVIVDRNGQNTIGRTREPMDSSKDGPGLEPLKEKLSAFGFLVTEVKDGNDIDVVKRNLGWARPGTRYYYPHPKVIICHTKKGKGLSLIEDKRDWHYRVPRGEELTQCQSDLGMPHYQPPATPQAKHGAAMRDRYFDALYEHFKKDRNLVLISADNGWPSIDKFAELKGQFYQVGIAEQQMVGMAAGMALQGRKVWCYAIAPFVTTRVHEFLKLDVCAMNLPIHMVGVGAGYAYDIMGPTHHTVEDIAIMRALPNMTIYGPADGPTAARIADEQVFSMGPSYVRLDRGGVPDVAGEVGNLEFPNGFRCPYYRSNAPLTIISTGIMTHTAMKVAEKVEVSVLDVFRLKPLDDSFSATIAGTQHIVTLEEHQLNGGLGSIVAEVLTDIGFKKSLLRIGVPNTFTFDLGGRAAIHEKYGLDVDSVVKRIQKWKKS